MPTVPWATRVQIMFLESRRGDFSRAQESKMLPSFWIEIKNKFFRRWPDRTAEAESQNDKIPEGTSNKKPSKKKSKTGVVVTSAPEISHEEWVALRKTVGLTGQSPSNLIDIIILSKFIHGLITTV